MITNNNVNSAIVSGVLGIQRANQGVAEHSQNLARLSVQSSQFSSPEDLLVNATRNQLSAIKQTLPQSASNITSDLVGLSVNLTNAQASTKVVDVAGDTVGTILDILA